uniref:Cytochrome c biogenesis protein CcsA n=2 Tax=Angiopteris TaxID=3266 RepID=A2T382_ANGEV|nr:cytochrome c biogenesis protein [Angiopteris evecta]YP_009992479.1 cytochrome c biogenesis protein [Angiopteris yunnanensis]ABG79649.1 cytochrome c heme attachment protein [Angiopteris evecta]QNN90664.1 cytochrome c biogenesis protein [Angiopteris yunnanensis]
MNIITENIFAHISFFLLSVATASYWGNLVYKTGKLSDLGKQSIKFAFISITGFLITRWVHANHLPLSNLYESFMFLSWSFSLLHINLELKSRNNDWLGAITAPSAMLTHSFATLGPPNEMQQSTMLVPALQSHWLMMHVSMMILSYATLLCGSLLAITLLIITHDNTNKSIVSTNTKFFLLFFPRERNSYLSTQIESDSKNTFYLLSRDFRKCQLIQQLDQWSYRTIGLGFPFLTIGILSGAVWANEAWGSYWSWDPKETWALITWLIYAIYLHTRMTKGWQGKQSATVASSGFFIVWICYLGVNLLGIGLHSYGWLIR